MVLNQQSLYTNQGNSSILQFLDKDDLKILDIGCGAGDTGRLIRSVYPSTEIFGITCSPLEQQKALHQLNDCFCFDLERDELPNLLHQEFDVLLFSHVLEHLVNPVAVIQKLLPLLKANGKVIIALPNIANWRDRWKLTSGKFEYTEGGVLDKTHLRFYTFHTAPKYLIDPISQLQLQSHTVSGSVPLAFLRHTLLSKQLRQRIDQLGCHWMPNLFGGEILIQAVKVQR